MQKWKHLLFLSTKKNTSLVYCGMILWVVRIINLWLYTVCVYVQKGNILSILDTQKNSSLMATATLLYLVFEYLPNRITCYWKADMILIIKNTSLVYCEMILWVVRIINLWFYMCVRTGREYFINPWHTKKLKFGDIILYLVFEYLPNELLLCFCSFWDKL